MTDNTREQTLLDQYWDADRVNRAYIPAELDGSLRETVDRVHQTDDAPDPDPAFVERLWADIGGVPSTTAAEASQSLTDDSEEPFEQQFAPPRKENDMLAKQQSFWRRRSRQILEMVAGILVLAVVTGGLILAYQNLIGTEEDPSPAVAPVGDEVDPTPTISEGEVLDQESIEDFREEVERNREIVENFEPDRVIDVDETLEYEGDEIHVVSVELSSEATVITTERDADLAILPLRGPGFSVRFPDGSVHESFSGGSETEPGLSVVQSEQFFPPVPEGAESIELVFHGFLVNDDVPIEVTFPVPQELAGVDVATGESEPHSIPIEYTFEVDDQSLEVTEIRTGANIGEEWFSIMVQNPELQQLTLTEESDWDAAEGLFQFRAQTREPDWITLVDDTGHEYEHSPYGVLFGLDGMGMGFEGPVNPEATEFTLRSERRGVVVQPFEPLEISLEDGDSGEATAIDTNDMTVYFPRQSEDVNEYDGGAPVGTLALDDQGCLRFGDENGPLIIWPYGGYSVDLNNDEVALINDETGDVIAYVGAEVSFHGSDPEYPMDSVPDHLLNEPLPEACADDGGYFITGPGINAP
jgi:hypothetical protein